MPAATRRSTKSKSRSATSTSKTRAGGKPAPRSGPRAAQTSKRSRDAARRGPKSAPRKGHAPRHATTDLVERHMADILGISLVVLGVLLALAVWANGAGPVGDALETGTRAVGGKGAVWLPLVLVGGGLGLAFTRGDRVRTLGVIGVVLAVAAVLGLIHLAGGAVPLDAPFAEIREHGGYVGAVLSVPLDAALGRAGAAVILGGAVLVGILVATGQSLRGIAAHTRSAWRVVTASFLEPPASAGEPPPPDADERPRHTASGPKRTAVPARPPGAAGGQAAGSVPDTTLYDQAAEVTVPPVDAEVDADAHARGGGSHTASRQASGGGRQHAPEQLRLREPKPADAEIYVLPALDLLRSSPERKVDTAATESRSEVIKATLDEFNVGAEVVGHVAGPTVTRYEVELAQGVKVNALLKLTPDICYALATPDVRILAPIPGRSAIGLEVPNAVRQMVTLGDILRSKQARAATRPLQVALGKDISGRPVMVDIADMPHLLIAGATGSGKSSSINSILTSILCRTRPSEVRMILIDPKRVELGRYGRIPHLLTGVVTNPKKAADALEWAVQEMDRRYDILQAAGSRDVVSYNQGVGRGEIKADDGEAPHTLPYILVVVDELADLMLVAPRNVEESIARITQMARAVGIHLVIATQRPSVNVITGVIKANIPTRMAFKVRTVTDSRVILDQAGAEKLVGQGDLLYLGSSASQCERIQASFVSEEEVAGIVSHWRAQAERHRETNAAEAPAVAVPADLDGEATPVPAVPDPGTVAGPAATGPAPGPEETTEPDVVFSGDLSVDAVRGDVDEESDALLGAAMELVVSSRLGSTSMLQRKLRVGFARAGRIMDLLEQHGVVGPSEGSKARKVLMAPEDLDGYRSRLGI
ncbi:MAG: DNA translocase FtsK 4TM domain-containing protein [Acidimicrobiia bacterium]|nr:DNA translocase FtsK 4TM domain-containing protein [Acidimicrobiia bacterium]